MKDRLWTWCATLIWMSVVVGRAQQVPADEGMQSKILERGAHHRVWQTYERGTNHQGKLTTITNSFTELATGLHYWEDGEWKETEAQFVIDAVGAVAFKGPHKVVLAPNIKSAGAVDLRTPDGKRLRSHILGLSYYDSSTGNSVLLAEVVDSIGQLIPANQVIYPSAFDDVLADVRYTYSRSGFEQDVILRENLPSPAQFGLDPKNTRLEILTEFIEAPEPQKRPSVLRTESDPVKRQAMVEPDFIDESLNFGHFQIRNGTAFALAEQIGEPGIRPGASIPVGKTWRQMEGRTILVEAVPYTSIKAQLEDLARVERVGHNGWRRVAGVRTIPQRRNVESEQPLSRVQIAQFTPPQRGLVIDYAGFSTTNLTNFTLKGDTTYYISGSVGLYGTTTIEGGVVVKFANTNFVTVGLFDSVVWPEASHRPAVFTAKDDNTVGETISGSTGSPSGYYADYALFHSSTNPIRNVRISHASNGLYINSTNTFEIYHAQFVNCDNAIALAGGGMLKARNVLMDNAVKGFSLSGMRASAEHLTANRVGDVFYRSNFGSDTNEVFFLTNSIAVVTNLPAGYLITNQAIIVTSAGGVFDAVGAGYHYLPTNSSYRNIGTTNINSELLKALQTLTTLVPVTLTNLVSSNLTLLPRGIGDSDIPDLGYHYPLADYAVGPLTITNATLCLTGGVSLAMFGTTAIWLQDGAQLKSEGDPTSLNRITRYRWIQEQPIAWGPTGAQMLINGGKSGSGISPSPVTLRFTELNTDPNSYSLDTSGLLRVSPLIVQDSVFNGGILNLYSFDMSGASFTLKNNLLKRVTIDFWGDATVTAYNNLFWKGSFLMFSYPETSATFKDNCFVESSFSEWWPGIYHGHNAYINQASRFTPNATNDVVLTNLTFLTGALGRFYQPTNSALINAGSRNATNAGLYHFTAMTNQVMETNSIVDIGFHYVAVDGNGKPLDSDLDGIPDYLEDTNGNGVFDTGDLGPIQLLLISIDNPTNGEQVD